MHVFFIIGVIIVSLNASGIYFSSFMHFASFMYLSGALLFYEGKLDTELRVQGVQDIRAHGQ